MAAATIASDNVLSTLIPSSGKIMLPGTLRSAEAKFWSVAQAIATTNLDDINDIILLTGMRLTDSLHRLELATTDLEGGSTLRADVGFYTVALNAGVPVATVVSGKGNYILSASTFFNAAASFTDVTFSGSKTLSSAGSLLYTDLGLPADDGYVYLGVKVTAAATTPAAGTIACRVYINR